MTGSDVVSQEEKWKDLFYQQYLTKDPVGYAASLSLKTQNMPGSLFRYRKWNGYTKREIERGEIFLSPPDQFNDIFDSFVACSWETIIADSKIEIEKNFRKRYPDPKEFEKIMGSRTWYRDLICDAARKEGTDPEHNYRALTAAIDKGTELLEGQLNKVIRSMVRIACFTTKPHNMPMWYHYAGNYEGVCLEYAVNSPALPALLRNSLLPVNYRTDMPDMIRLLKEAPMQFFKYAATLKNSDWSYEDEWRLVLTLGDIYYSYEDVPQEQRSGGVVCRFLPVRAVYIGDQMKQQEREKIHALAREKGFNVYQMRPVRGKYVAERQG